MNRTWRMFLHLYILSLSYNNAATAAVTLKCIAVSTPVVLICPPKYHPRIIRNAVIALWCPLSVHFLSRVSAILPPFASLLEIIPSCDALERNDFRGRRQDIAASLVSSYAPSLNDCSFIFRCRFALRGELRSLEILSAKERKDWINENLEFDQISKEGKKYGEISKSWKGTSENILCIGKVLEKYRKFPRFPHRFVSFFSQVCVVFVRDRYRIDRLSSSLVAIESRFFYGVLTTYESNEVTIRNTEFNPFHTRPTFIVSLITDSFQINLKNLRNKSS